MKKIIFAFLLLTGMIATAQVKIGDDVTNVNANSLLELETTNKGLLLPRVLLTGTANVAPLAAHVEGMTVYNTNTAGDVTPGVYTNDGTKWVKQNGGGVRVITAGAGANQTISATDYIVIINTPSAGSTITLPDPTLAVNKGRHIFVRNGSVQAVPSGAGTMNFTLPYPVVNQALDIATTLPTNKGYELVSDGLRWYCISGF